ncbi:MAG: 50S ribosomal protein L24 [Syntrophomonadaceae bacterium]|jgi:large subunit ribosomal protein L24
MRIKKGDIVLVTTGKDAGKKGKILKVLPGKNKVVVEGINRVKKHQKPNKSVPQGGILRIESPMDASNVMLMCNKCDKPTRISSKILENNQKVRVCKNCGEIID